MEEIGVSLVQKLPAWYLELLLPIIGVAAIFVFSHIKRDKQGKFYWFSRAYEDRKCNAKLDKILDDIQDVQRKTSRLELLDLVSHKPHAKDIILSKYDEYKKNGWNSYIDIVIERWKEENK
jgi:hypothetical protein